jgi:hypothetical protein
MRLQNALAVRTEAVPFPGTADAGPPYNDCPAQTSGFPENARAVIHCPAPSVMQGGRSRGAEWALEFEPRARPFIEPLMGWTGGTDTLAQVRLRFPSREAAIAYANRQRVPYEVREPVHVHRDEPGPLATIAEHHVPIEVTWAWEAPHLALDRLLVANDAEEAARALPDRRAA